MGYEFSDAAGPVDSGFLHLGDLTILFGANDVGKSSLLQAVAAGLGSHDALLRGAEFVGDHRFFVKLHQDDARQLLSITYRRDVDELSAAGISDDGESGAEDLPWLEYLPKDARSLDPRSSTFALETLAEWCGQPTGGAPGLLVSWARDPEPLAGAYSFSSGDKAVLMGTIELPVLPRAIALPTADDGWLRREVSAAMSAWIAHVQWGLSNAGDLDELGESPFDAPSADAWLDLAEGFRQSVEIQQSARALWTTSDEGSVSYRPIARTACNFVGQIATRLAPAFVSDRYELRIQPVGLLDWSDDAPVRLSLIARDGSGGFDIRQAADGLRLWLQISLLEAADAMTRVELNLRHALLAIEQAPDAATRQAAITAYRSQLNTAITEATDIAFERSLGAAFARAPGMDSPYRDERESATDAAHRVASARPRLYLLDEPERHLNPRLQRVAAKWLVDLLQSRGSQGLVATHAHAFLNLGTGASYVEVRREEAGRSSLIPFNPDELTAYSEIAKTVGLDQGELLTAVQVLAFVEGRHDQAVLEELFRLQFFHAGVVVVPIAGVGRHSQIVEHDVLIRFTRASLAVVFDKIDRPTIDRLQTDLDFRLESLRSRHTEIQAMASLLQKAVENGRAVHPMALPVADIFDALDEAILQDQYPKFPGHEAANAAWEDARKKVPNRKIFYQDRYGVPNEIETYRKVAGLMRSLGRVSEQLRDVCSDLERLADSSR